MPICNAIQNRESIEFTYEGSKHEVEPYCHGTSLAGLPVLRAWANGAWKLFEISKISNVKIIAKLQGPFRPGYNQFDSKISSIHCRV